MTSNFKQARYYQKGRRRSPIWVVIHTAETGEGPHVAEALADYAATMKDGRQVSWHYSIDNNSIVQSVKEQDTAFAAGPANSLGIHLELAGRASQSVEQWADAYSQALLENAARLVAQICARYNIPIAHPSNESVLALSSGIVGHDQISWASQEARKRDLRVEPWYNGSAFRLTTHTDPGKHFPWASFLELVRGSSSRP